MNLTAELDMEIQSCAYESLKKWYKGLTATVKGREGVEEGAVNCAMQFYAVMHVCMYALLPEAFRSS